MIICRHIHNHTLKAFYLLLLTVVVACNPTKHLKPEESLVNRVRIKSDSRKVSKEELYTLVKQKPNRRILGVFRFHLGIYNLYKKDSDDKVRKTVGEPPVLYDSLLTDRTLQQMKLLMHNKGYFECEVQAIAKTQHQKTKVMYRVRSKQPYIMEKPQIDCNDVSISEILNTNKYEIQALEGQAFDTEKLNKLRETLSRAIRNNGYYFFSKENISYTADTSKREHSVGIILHVSPFKERAKNIDGNDTVLVSAHKSFKIGNIYIKQDYNQASPAFTGDTILYKNIHFIQNGKPRFKPSILEYTLLLEKGGHYYQWQHERSYRRFTALRVFNYTNIQFTRTPTDSVPENLLDCYVYLSPMLTRSFTLESEGTNTGGNFGIAGNVSYQNRNLFRGAELLNVKMRGGIEAQPLIIRSPDNAEIINNLPFNTIEVGPELSLEFPKFLVPNFIYRAKKSANPKTIVHTSYNFQQRPDYMRSLFQVDFGYYWNESEFKRHIISPVDLSLIKLNPQPAFKALLDTIKDPFILNTYRDHLILASRYSYIFNNQTKPKQRHYTYLRFNIETAGNTLNTLSKAIDLELDELGSFEILGIRFAQYLRSNVDFRYYLKRKKATTVFRFAGGAGLAYGNVDALPFEKGFFAGGANGMRAWRVRTLGPGSLPDSLINNRIDQIGEMQLEGNIEFRFDITKVFKGAFFLDAGNIWMLNKNPNRPGAEFNINRLWTDIAIGSGFGLRLDFSYFLLRFDLGVPVKMPSSENPTLIKPRFDAPPINLGIGYPF